MGTTDVQNDITNFVQYLDVVKKRTVLTQAHYRSYLKRFVSDMHIKTTEDITHQKILQFKQILRKCNLKKTTQNYHLIALRNFIRWLPEKKGLIPYRLIKLNEVPYHPPQRVPQPIIKAVLNAPDKAPHKTILILRDRALLEILYTLKMKLDDIPKLRIAHYNSQKKLLSTPANVSTHVQKLTNIGQFHITEYLKKRNDSNQYLFISHDRAHKTREQKPLSIRSIQRLIDKYTKQSGYTAHITARTLRQDDHGNE